MIYKFVLYNTKMDETAQNFLKGYSLKDAIILIRVARWNNWVDMGILIAQYMEKIFPNSPEIKEELSMLLSWAGKHREAFLKIQDILKLPNLDINIVNRAIFNRKLMIPQIKELYTYYNHKKVSKIEKRGTNLPKITLTMTTCKRLNLFTKTVNSLLNCCTDLHLIDKWFVVDDNSSDEDREIMKKLYPFIDFYFKSPEEKGHPQSMNIILKMVKTPYIFHLEDDWCFFEKRNYISDCLEILNQNENYGQCLVNVNYSETESDNILGGIPLKTPSGLRYFEHDYFGSDTNSFVKKYGNGSNCAYWPHFSFRPSLIRRGVFENLGEFNETVSHFEMDYSYRYMNKGYKSVFLETIYCIHTGRLTSERGDPTKQNAYILNNEAQFAGKEEQVAKKTKNIKTFVINLDKRPDRWNKFTEHKEVNFLSYERFSAVDGSRLKPTEQLQQIFENNDYNMRKGMVGCAMSHIKLYLQLLEDKDTDTYCILEDDLDFVPDFEEKFKFCVKELDKTDWDMLYLGHHLWQQYIDDEVYSKTLWPKIEQFNRSESLKRSMGGTGGYLINKKGAEKLLEYINEHGMTNGIDTVQQKSADILNIYYAYPHLIYSECYRGDNNTDTDIQYNFDSLTIQFNQRLKNELSVYDGDIIEVANIEDIPSVITTPIYYEGTSQEIIQLKNSLVYPCYTICNKVIFILPSDNGRYIHRFKKNGVWNIADALIYEK